MYSGCGLTDALPRSEGLPRPVQNWDSLKLCGAGILSRISPQVARLRGASWGATGLREQRGFTRSLPCIYAFAYFNPGVEVSGRR
jgi:hypothetical protein